ncbi:MAG TPA: HD domain-containing protein [Geobacteraceae bacterium]|nr:HD domain-containing protein [Geobacteraceae bacterium]
MEIEELERLREWFASYCRSFITENEADNRNYLVKEIHTRHVCENMALLTGSIGLPEGDRLTAEAIALFHDVGRFEQYRRFSTFRDDISVNHGALGGQVLHENRVLEGLPAEERRSILHGVTLHNVYRLPAELNERDMLYARLIRDADKLDIWRIFVEYDGLPNPERASAVGLDLPDLPECSPEVLESLERRELVRLATVKSLNDFKLLQLSWVFDLNFPASFRLALERGLIKGLAATLPADRSVTKALGIISDYAAGRAAQGDAHA